MGLIGLSVWQVGSFRPIHNFLLLLALIICVQFSAQSLPVSKKAGVTFSVATAINLAVIPLYGPYAAIILDVVSVTFIWLIKPFDETTWKKKLPQLTFNNGMTAIASFMAGQFFVTLAGQTDSHNAYITLPVWLITVIIYDQLNWWLVIIILKLQHGKTFGAVQMWRDNRWATVINIGIGSIAGGVLVLATVNFDWLGIIVFFLPIALSAYAFHVYVSQTRAQMANMESIIAERTQELAQLNSEKDAFLALLTHDMKSPLTSIGMYAEMMRRKPDLILTKPHTIENILRAHATLTDLVNNIVDLEKLQSGDSLSIDRSLFDVVDLTEYVVEILQPQAEQKQIALTNDLANQPIQINADRLQIERILTNLVSNAVKYTNVGGRITVEVKQTDDDVCIAVQDTGYGIPEDDLPFIFDRYRRVDKHRNKAVGTGLGLAIAKAIAEGHGGTLVAESAENIGSTFTLTLPLP